MSNSLRPHKQQHTNLPCPSPTPRAYSTSCSLSQWCHPTISSSAIPFSFYHQSFPASGSFPKRWLFASGGQSTGISASVSVLPVKIQDWLTLELTGFDSLQVSGFSTVFSSSTIWKHQFFTTQFPYGPALTSVHEAIALTIRTFAGKVMSLPFNMLSRFIIAFPSKEQTSFNFMSTVMLQSLSTEILEPKKIKSVTISTVTLLFAMKWWDQISWC